MTSIKAGSLRFAVSLILVGVLLDFHHKHNLEDIFSWLRKHLFISILICVLKYQERIFQTIGSIFFSINDIITFPHPPFRKSHGSGVTWCFKGPLCGTHFSYLTSHMLCLSYERHPFTLWRLAWADSVEWRPSGEGFPVFLCSPASCRLILMLCLALRTLLPTQGTSQGTVPAGSWFFWGMSCCVKIDTSCLSNPSMSLVGGGGVRQDTKVT